MNELKGKVISAINKIRPFLNADGGDIELIEITEEKVVIVKLTGACQSCPWSTDTMQLGVEQTIRHEVPEISGVIRY